MNIFRRKPAPLPDKSVEARIEADEQQKKANALLAVATRISASVKNIREENHIAEAIQYAHRSNK